MAMRRRYPGPGELGERWLQLRWSHVGPDSAADFHWGIRRGTNLVLEIQLFWLVHHIDTVTVNVELPPAIDAAQATLLGAAKKHRHAPMWAGLLQHSDTAR